MEIIAVLHYSPSTFARRMCRENEGDEPIADVLNFTQTWVSFGVLAEQVSAGEIRSAIESALANGALSQEKAAWLLEGFEKGFVIDRRFLQK